MAAKLVSPYMADRPEADRAVRAFKPRQRNSACQDIQLPMEIRASSAQTDAICPARRGSRRGRLATKATLRGHGFIDSQSSWNEEFAEASSAVTSHGTVHRGNCPWPGRVWSASTSPHAGVRRHRQPRRLPPAAVRPALHFQFARRERLLSAGIRAAQRSESSTMPHRPTPLFLHCRPRSASAVRACRRDARHVPDAVITLCIAG